MENVAKVSHSHWRTVWKRFQQHKLAVVSLVYLSALVIACCFAESIAYWLDVSPYKDDLIHRFAETGNGHILGRDELGRDTFTRLLVAGKVSLLFSFIAAVSIAILGTSLGMLAGYFGGRIDALIMRLVDLTLSIPVIMLLVIIQGSDLVSLALLDQESRSSFTDMTRLVVVTTVLGWPFTARVVRAKTLVARNYTYVHAAIGYGASHRFVMIRHIFPEVKSAVIVAITLSMGGAILTESALSYLGFGIRPSTPSWGNMLNSAYDAMWHYPWFVLYTGGIIMVTVVAINLLGDGIQGAIDPRASMFSKRAG